MGLDIQNDSVYLTDMECLRIKRIAMEKAAHNILLADASKLKKVGLFRLSGVNDFERVYINDDGSGRQYPENVIVVK